MKYLTILMMLLLSSCSNHVVKDYEAETPKINLKEFFNGNIYALGIVQDRSGKVIKRFKVDILASWEGQVATLDEKFVYSDNSKSQRVWKLTEVGPNQYAGRAGDVIDVAVGETSGNAFYFEYILDLPVGDTSYKVKFEDWMYLLDDNTLMARSYMSKWGFDLGEVTIVMMKKK